MTPKKKVDLESLLAQGFEVWDTMLPGESDNAFMAFQHYRKVRSYRKVSEELNLRETLIRNWAVRFRWKDRIDAYVRARAELAQSMYYEILSQHAPKALKVLSEGMEDPNAPLRDRRQCAVDVLKMLGLYHETVPTVRTVSEEEETPLTRVLQEIRERALLWAQNPNHFELELESVFKSEKTNP